MHTERLQMIRSVIELKTLSKLTKTNKEVLKLCYAYYEFTKNNQFSFDIKTKQYLYCSWYSKLSDLLEATLKSEKCFINNKQLFNNLNDFAQQKITIPEFLKSTNDKSETNNVKISANDDVSLRRVIKIARNHAEHPDKTNQEIYCILTDFISIDILLLLNYKIDTLIVNEIKSLTNEELQVMISESIELKRNILALQEVTKKYLPTLEQCEQYTPGMRKMVQTFLEFIPNRNNIVLK